MSHPIATDLTVPLERISRQDLHHETTARLAQLIASAEPGSRLPTERELSERLGVGRSTLREAMRSLAFIGAIQPRQGSGTYVSPVDGGAVDRLIGLGLMVLRSRVEEVVEARRVLEVEAARLAAARHDEADRAELEAVLARMREATAEPAVASAHDLHFHVLLARASHNGVLVHFINGMRSLLEIWMTTAVNREVVVADVVREHGLILDAVFARDADLAATRMAEHLSHAAERLFAVVGEDRSMSSYVALMFAR